MRIFRTIYTLFMVIIMIQLTMVSSFATNNSNNENEQIQEQWTENTVTLAGGNITMEGSDVKRSYAEGPPGYLHGGHTGVNVVSETDPMFDTIFELQNVRIVLSNLQATQVEANEWEAKFRRGEYYPYDRPDPRVMILERIEYLTGNDWVKRLTMFDYREAKHVYSARDIRPYMDVMKKNGGDVIVEDCWDSDLELGPKGTVKIHPSIPNGYTRVGTGEFVVIAANLQTSSRHIFGYILDRAQRAGFDLVWRKDYHVKMLISRNVTDGASSSIHAIVGTVGVNLAGGVTESDLKAGYRWVPAHSFYMIAPKHKIAAREIELDQEPVKAEDLGFDPNKSCSQRGITWGDWNRCREYKKSGRLSKPRVKEPDKLRLKKSSQPLMLPDDSAVEPINETIIPRDTSVKESITPTPIVGDCRSGQNSKSIHFKIDRSSLSPTSSPDYKQVLPSWLESFENQVSCMQANPSWVFGIRSNASEPHDEDYNYKISKRRANSCEVGFKGTINTHGSAEAKQFAGRIDAWPGGEDYQTTQTPKYVPAGENPLNYANQRCMLFWGERELIPKQENAQ